MSGGRKKNHKLWEKGTPIDKKIEAYTVGDDYLLDQKLVSYDCKASIAHVKMLERIGILKKDEAEKLSKSLNEILNLDEKGIFAISREQEDCHTAIENHLTARLGDLGKKIHTARSRNDQVLTALRLYYKDSLDRCKNLASSFSKSLRRFTRKYGKIQMPGYTHTRKAMPSSVLLWGNAFLDSMKDNLKLISTAFELVDQSPLGTGAGYGIPLKIDRKITAQRLGFKKVQENPIYAQISRGKFEATMLHAFSQIMLDLNKIASDIIFFSMPEFGYFEIPKEFCTGSSIMPQKNNPDVLELVRAYYHEVVACEFQVKSTTGNLISGYNRDLQLTKKAVIRGTEITLESLDVMAHLFQGLRVNYLNCVKGLTPEIFATNEVYDLVRSGVPFREAYRMVAEKFS